MRIICQVHLFQCLFYELFEIVRANAFDLGVEVEMVVHRQVFEDCFELWAVADHASGLVVTFVRSDIVATHEQLPDVWRLFSC